MFSGVDLLGIFIKIILFGCFKYSFEFLKSVSFFFCFWIIMFLLADVLSAFLVWLSGFSFYKSIAVLVFVFNLDLLIILDIHFGGDLNFMISYYAECIVQKTLGPCEASWIYASLCKSQSKLCRLDLLLFAYTKLATWDCFCFSNQTY